MNNEEERNIEVGVKKKALEATFSQITKQFGEGSVMILGQSSAATNCEVISSGLLLLDQVIGIGGFPVGRIIEIYGPEASGKTTIALQVIAEAQKLGETCAFIDVEHALDPSYSTKLGININHLVLSQPDYGEQAFDILEMLIRSGVFKVIVVDSVAALVTKEELEGAMVDKTIAGQAKMMSLALRKITPLVHKFKVMLIFINQIRHTINSMPFANKEVTSGGNALKFYASLRLEVKRIASLKDKDGGHKGNKIVIKVVKNKMAPPFKKVELDLFFGQGISRESDLLNAALIRGLIKQSGSHFSFENEKIGHGQDQVLKYLTDNPHIAKKLYSMIKEDIASKSADTTVAIEQNEFEFTGADKGEDSEVMFVEE